MKWWILGIVIFLGLPFYIFVLSQCASLGKIKALSMFERFSHKQKTSYKEDTINGKEKE